MKSRKLKGDLARNVDFVLDCTAHRPRWAVILGSGLASIAERINHHSIFPYESFYRLPAPSVKGHAGRLVVGLFGGTAVAVFQGRPHIYEGFSPEQTLMSIRIASGIGVRNMIITSAAGGLNPSMRAGDLMVIRDHIDLMPAPALPPPDKTATKKKVHEPIYDDELIVRFEAACAARRVSCTRGVYAGLSGPAYETPAETRFFSRIGADAVGMSTVHEASAARSLGMKVLGVSCISNVIGAHAEAGPDHDAVLETAGRAAEPLADVLETFIKMSCFPS